MDDIAINVGSIIVGAVGIGADLARGGPIGTSATLGICLVLLGIHGLRIGGKLPKAWIRRTR